MNQPLQHCLNAMDIDVWVPRSMTAVQTETPIMSDHYRVVYQAQNESDWLVVCDRAAIDQWIQARKLLANILYFLDARPGTYHIITPAMSDEPSEDFWDIVKSKKISQVISFGENLSIDSSSDLGYVKMSSLGKIIENPEDKQEVLHGLLESGIQKTGY